MEGGRHSGDGRRVGFTVEPRCPAQRERFEFGGRLVDGDGCAEGMVGGGCAIRGALDDECVGGGADGENDAEFIFKLQQLTGLKTR